jgi:hypothetical protein
MSVIKSLWASVQGDPVFMRKVNGWLTILWVVMIPVSILTGWIGSGPTSPRHRCGRSYRDTGRLGKRRA